LVLDGHDGPVTETKYMIKVATSFYKKLFGKEDRLDIRLKDVFFSNNEKVTPEENITLESRFTLEEVKEAVFGSYADGAPWTRWASFFFLLPTLLGVCLF
jgi:hypothetical protein